VTRAELGGVPGEGETRPGRRIARACDRYPGQCCGQVFTFEIPHVPAGLWRPEPHAVGRLLAALSLAAEPPPEQPVPAA
jgi:hypothetical protein